MGGVYLIQAVIAGIVGVGVDWLLHEYRQRVINATRQPRFSGQVQPRFCKVSMRAAFLEHLISVRNDTITKPKTG